MTSDLRDKIALAIRTYEVRKHSAPVKYFVVRADIPHDADYGRASISGHAAYDDCAKLNADAALSVFRAEQKDEDRRIVELLKLLTTPPYYEAQRAAMSELTGILQERARAAIALIEQRQKTTEGSGK